MRIDILRVELQRLEERLGGIEQRALVAECRLKAMTERAAASEKRAEDAEVLQDKAEAELRLAERREGYAKERHGVIKRKLKEVAPLTQRRTTRDEDYWSEMSRWARYKAAERDASQIRTFLQSGSYRVSEIAVALEAEGFVEQIFETKPFFAVFFAKVEKLVKFIETEHFGIEFGLMLHYDLHLPVAKILQLTQAASKAYDHMTNTYVPKPLLFDPFHVAKNALCGERTQKFIPLPRIAPPASKLLSVMRKLEAELDVDCAEDGRIAMKSFTLVVGEMLAQDPSRFGLWNA